MIKYSPNRASTQGRSDRGQNRPRLQHNKQNTSLIMKMSNKTSNIVHKFAGSNLHFDGDYCATEHYKSTGFF